ncbi:cytochrome C [Sulfuricaulis limicola]|uniref:Cytochrome C n=2 Tax=Sulfuricaulis limicola TaxID=1620215 RepID=A0A1B4XH08_9GAMM|nr:cytochrome C [Sulfuricaulis limicola]
MKIRYGTGLLLGGMLALSNVVMADGDSYSRRGKSADVAPVNNTRYAKECGSCHFAYQPGLLPARSWRKLMGNLADHFGDNAELPQEDAAAIADYLVKNAADRSNHRRSVKISDSLSPGQTPIRISQVPYIVSKHDEIPARLITGNPKVKSLTQCQACHSRAEAGLFSEHEINIPGHGPWEDD